MKPIQYFGKHNSKSMQHQNLSATYVNQSYRAQKEDCGTNTSELLIQLRGVKKVIEFSVNPLKICAKYSPLLLKRDLHLEMCQY